MINENQHQRFTLEHIHQNLNRKKSELTKNRIEIEPNLYDKYLNHREHIHKKAPRESSLKPSSLYPGSWYLKSIDEKYRRVYDRAPANAQFNSENTKKYLIDELTRIA